MLIQRTWRSRLLALAGGPLLGYLSWLLLARRLETLRSGMQRATLFHLSRPDQLDALVAYERRAWAPALGDLSLVAALAGLLLAVVLVGYALSARRDGGTGGGRRGRLGRRERAVQKQDMRERAELAREVKAELSPPLLADAAALRREGWTAREGLPLGPLCGGPDVFIPPVTCNSHVLVYGTTGSGKTRRVLLPAVLHATTLSDEARPSMLIFDPKEELTDYTAQGLSGAGYAVYVYKPTAAGSMRCNVLADAGSFAAVRRVMEQWLACQVAPSPSGAAGHYRRVRLALLVGAAHLLRRQHGSAWRTVSLADVAAFYRPPRTIDTIMEDLRPLLAGDGVLDPQLADTVGLLGDLAAKPAAFADVMTELRDLMAATWDPAICSSMRGHDLGPAFWAAFVARPSVLYVPFAIRETRSLRPVIVTFFDFALEQVRACAPLPRPVRVVIDEFANLGPVDRMEEHISTVRSAGIGFVLATQTPGDIARVYGGSRAGALEGNIATKLMLSGSDPELLASWQMRDFGLLLPHLMRADTMTVRRSSGLPFQVRTRDVSRGPYRCLVGGAGATAGLLAFQREQLEQGGESTESRGEESTQGGGRPQESTPEKHEHEEPEAVAAPLGRGRQISAWE